MSFNPSIKASVSVRVCTLYRLRGSGDVKFVVGAYPTCSVGLRSGDRAGHSIIRNRFFPNPGRLWWRWLCLLGHYLASGWNLASQCSPCERSYNCTIDWGASSQYLAAVRNPLSTTCKSVVATLNVKTSLNVKSLAKCWKLLPLNVISLDKCYKRIPFR